MPALAESTPEEDSKADASNSASLYKVLSAKLALCLWITQQNMNVFLCENLKHRWDQYIVCIEYEWKAILVEWPRSFVHLLSPFTPFIFSLQVSDATGSMTMTKVSEKSPFGQELLLRDDCFILDNGANGKIFIWKGEEKQNTPSCPCKHLLPVSRYWIQFHFLKYHGNVRCQRETYQLNEGGFQTSKQIQGSC